MNLLDEAKYFPVNRGRYIMKVRDGSLEDNAFGNGVLDGRVFQIDEKYFDYRKSIVSARENHFNKCSGLWKYPENLEERVTNFIIEKLTIEYPNYFSLRDGCGDVSFYCSLTNEELCFEDIGKLIGVFPNVFPGYVNSLDALASQVQEDIAIVSLDDKGGNYVSGVHVCMANDWVPSEILGKDFVEVHGPVPGIDRFKKESSNIVKRMIEGEPYVRFIWELNVDNCLNHFSGISEKKFDVANPELYMRVERQVIHAIPNTRSALFTIRPYVYNVASFDIEEKKNLALALERMDDDVLEYKCLTEARESIIEWLNS
jgi:dimethylamine monooxygenase subunit A